MIGSLSGRVIGLIRGSVIIEVAGVGYRVAVTPDTLTSLAEGDATRLWTYLAVRENSQDLYGFPNKDDLQWFELLLTVSGIGPKSALAILSSVDTGSLKRAIEHNDSASLARAHGVGKKTADKIVLELQEKVGAVETKSQGEGGDGDVIDALIGLGYSTKEARDAARLVSREVTTTEDKIREAIRLASRA